MSGEGHNRLKNWPGVTESALGEASTTRCLYSAFTQSCDRTGHSDSSAGICAAVLSPATAFLPTRWGAEANGSPFIGGNPRAAAALPLFFQTQKWTDAVPKSRFIPIFERSRCDCISRNLPDLHGTGRAET